MGRKLKLVTLKSIPPETNRKVKKAIKEDDKSLEAADAKLEYAGHQAEDLDQKIRKLVPQQETA